MSKNILITGASSGFGLLLAEELHRKGYNVIGTSRNSEKLQNTVSFKVLSLDITDDNSIKAFTETLFTHIKTLDVLINNAGYYLAGLAEETTIEQGKQQFETNFWGTIKVTNELLPYFRKQRSGKILTVGSILGLLNFPYSSYYGASKHALEGYFKSLRYELSEFNIKVAMIEPMSFKTNIAGNSVLATKNISDYNTYRSKLNAFSKDLFEKSPEPSPVIKQIIKVVEEQNPTFSHPVGKGSSLFLAIQLFAYKVFENTMIANINKFKR